MVKVVSFIAALNLAFVAPALSTWTVGQEVATYSGFYKGHESPFRPGVSEYLGIKYGEETSGPRRFAKPVAFKSVDRFSADKFGLNCPSILTNATGPMAGVAEQAGANHESGEDCLTVNVWTKPQVGERKKAGMFCPPADSTKAEQSVVMVYVYGGGFNVGSTQDKTFDGSVYADEEDVVVVSAHNCLSQNQDL
jgi:cholinesterase